MARAKSERGKTIELDNEAVRLRERKKHWVQVVGNDEQPPVEPAPPPVTVVTRTHEQRLREALGIPPPPPAPARTEVRRLRRRVAAEKRAAPNARLRVVLANFLFASPAAGDRAEAMELYRTVATLNWSSMMDEGLNPTLPARLVLSQEGEWVGSIASGSLKSND